MASEGEPKTAWALTIEHKCGIDVRLFRTEEVAKKWLIEYCRDMWRYDEYGSHKHLSDEKVINDFFFYHYQDQYYDLESLEIRETAYPYELEEE